MDGEGYVSWLQEKSMLADAGTIAGQFSGTGDVWQNSFTIPIRWPRFVGPRCGSPPTRFRRSRRWASLPEFLGG